MTSAVARKRMGTRRFIYESFLRGDGLWDIEAEILDFRDYSYAVFARSVEAGQPVHNMRIRLTVDEGLLIRDIVTDIDHAPFAVCQQTRDPMLKMIGVKIGPGWRREIESRLGGTKGCTHLRDLLLNAATAAYQSVIAYERFMGRIPKVAPYALDNCMTWAVSGPTVREFAADYYVPPASEREQDD